MSSKRIVILGGGESGAGAAVLARVLGYDVFVSDAALIKEQYKTLLKTYDIPFEEGKHSLSAILNATEIVKSPGIPDNVPVMKTVLEKNIPVISEIEFAARHTNAQLIAITGSNGKTTTTLLTHHILRKAGMNVGLAGNVGNSFAFQVATEKYDIYVLEISSFQLDYCFEFSPHIAVLLNITPDHLDRYENSMELYTASKFRITQKLKQTDYFVYNADDQVIRSYMSNHVVNGIHIPFSQQTKPQGDCAYVENNKIVVNIHQNRFEMIIEKLALQGKHNVYDSMAAAISSRLMDIRNNVLKESLSDFINAEHRLESVARVHGIEFINDSKATNVNSTWYALESINKKIIWIAGGQDKGNDYTDLIEMVKEKVKAIVCLGIDNSKLKKTFGGIVANIYETDNMWDAVNIAYRLGSPGDVVLLSPACASFDLFENYEDRGNQFKKAVRNL